ncbi:MAG: translation initiation factor IF-2 associated domain-containing protein, partial [Pseudomonadota bacterium]
MSETKTPDDKTRGGAPTTKTLTLKRPAGEANVVRQSFSQGRSKSVLVEVQKKRRFTADGKPAPVAAAAPAPAPAATPAPASSAPKLSLKPGGAPKRAAPTSPRGMVLRELSDDEIERRAQILAEAKVREAHERKQAEEDGVRRSQIDEQLRRDREAAEARRSAEDERHKREDDVKRRSEGLARTRLGEATSPTVVRIPESGEDDAPRRNLGGALKRPTRAAPAKPSRDDGQRRMGRMTVTRATSDDEERARSVASFRRRNERVKRRAMGD